MDDRIVVILVGAQGSGKSWYCRHSLGDWPRISQDEGPRTFEGVVRRLGELLSRGERQIVIDRTNPMRSQRARFIELARAAGYRTRIVYFDVPVEECRRRVIARRDHPTLAAAQMEQALSTFLARLDVPLAGEADELCVNPP